MSKSIGSSVNTLQGYIGTSAINNIADGTIKGAIGNTSIAGIGSSNNITSAISSLNTKLGTTNTNLSTLATETPKYPDYSIGRKTLFDVASSANDKSYTMTEDGFIIGESYNNTSTEKILFLRLTINGGYVFEGFSEKRNYNYLCSPIFPVKKGDVVTMTGEWVNHGTGPHAMQLKYFKAR